uniref:Uncharacterized protein n=1 Tax=Picea sitchensis TaxID=3332 RepID=A0A6B9XX96_PICSI|nr:hypothetical protein Q903MT_gene6680 [Picea sitchensis]
MPGQPLLVLPPLHPRTSSRYLPVPVPTAGT